MDGTHAGVLHLRRAFNRADCACEWNGNREGHRGADRAFRSHAKTGLSYVTVDSERLQT